MGKPLNLQLVVRIHISAWDLRVRIRGFTPDIVILVIQVIHNQCHTNHTGHTSVTAMFAGCSRDFKDHFVYASLAADGQRH